MPSEGNSPVPAPRSVRLDIWFGLLSGSAATSISAASAGMFPTRDGSLRKTTMSRAGGSVVYTPKQADFWLGRLW